MPQTFFLAQCRQATGSRAIAAAASPARKGAGINSRPSEGEQVARKRELIDVGTDNRGYVRRNKLGSSFVESDDVGRSLAADQGKPAKTWVKLGEGNRPRPRRQTTSNSLL